MGVIGSLTMGGVDIRGASDGAVDGTADAAMFSSAEIK